MNRQKATPKVGDVSTPARDTVACERVPSHIERLHYDGISSSSMQVMFHPPLTPPNLWSDMRAAHHLLLTDPKKIATSATRRMRSRRRRVAPLDRSGCGRGFAFTTRDFAIGSGRIIARGVRVNRSFRRGFGVQPAFRACNPSYST